MPNRPANALFQLIKSLKKSEKRNFKLYVKRNSSAEDLKIIQLFDALDRMEQYDEDVLLKKNASIKKLVIELRKHDEICFDTETTGIDANEAELVGLSFSIKPGEAYYIPCPPDQIKTK